MPFFNIIAFVIGTYINARTKKLRLAALRRKVRLPDQWVLQMLGTRHFSVASYGFLVISLGLSGIPLFWQCATADQSNRRRFVGGGLSVSCKKHLASTLVVLHIRNDTDDHFSITPITEAHLEGKMTSKGVTKRGDDPIDGEVPGGSSGTNVMYLFSSDNFASPYIVISPSFP